MKIIIRVKNPDTKRYRRVQDVEFKHGSSGFVDSEHLVYSLHDSPFVVDGMNVLSDTLYLNLTQAWNKKRPKVQSG